MRQRVLFETWHQLHQHISVLVGQECGQEGCHTANVEGLIQEFAHPDLKWQCAHLGRADPLPLPPEPKVSKHNDQALGQQQSIEEQEPSGYSLCIHERLDKESCVRQRQTSLHMYDCCIHKGGIQATTTTLFCELNEGQEVFDSCKAVLLSKDRAGITSIHSQTSHRSGKIVMTDFSNLDTGTKEIPVERLAACLLNLATRKGKEISELPQVIKVRKIKKTQIVYLSKCMLQTNTLKHRTWTC